MNDLDNALFCEKYNRMNEEDKKKREQENAYMNLVNMNNMLLEHWRENPDLPIPLRGEEPSKTISNRYGIMYQSEFRAIWVILERVCKGQYQMNKREPAQEWNSAIDAVVKIMFDEDGDFQQYKSPATVRQEIEALKLPE